ncbi:MAG: hypothetical protein ACTSVT_09390, partial [Candidatus Thorarchaeota archaeon]
MIIHQVVYTSIKTPGTSGYQIVCHSGLSERILNAVADHSTLRGQIPPEYEFEEAISVQRLPSDLVGITYMFNAGLDFAGRPNRIFSHTLCVKNSDFRTVKYNPFPFLEYAFKNEEEYSKVAGEDVIPGSAALPTIRAETLTERVLAPSELVGQLQNFGLVGKQLSAVLDALTGGRRIVLVVSNDTDCVSIVRTLLHLVPVPLRADLFPMSFGLSLRFLSEHHQLIVSPVAAYTRARVEEVPAILDEIDLTGSPTPLNTKEDSYGSQVAWLLQTDPAKVTEFVQRVWRMIESVESPQVTPVKAIAKISKYLFQENESLRQQNSDPHIAVETLISAIRHIREILPTEAIEGYKRAQELALASNHEKMYMESTVELLKLLSERAPNEFLNVQQLALMDTAQLFPSLLPDLLETALETVPNQSSVMRNDLIRDTIQLTETDPELSRRQHPEEPSLAERIFEVLERYTTAEALAQIASQMLQEDKKGAYDHLLRNRWAVHAERTKDAKSLLRLIRLAQGNLEEQKRYYSSAQEIALERGERNLFKDLFVARVRMGELGNEDIKSLKRYVAEVVRTSSPDQISHDMNAILESLTQQQLTRSLREVIPEYVKRLTERQYWSLTLRECAKFLLQATALNLDAVSMVSTAVRAAERLEEEVRAGRLAKFDSLVVRALQQVIEYIRREHTTIDGLEKIVPDVLACAMQWVAIDHSAGPAFAEALRLYADLKGTDSAIKKVTEIAESYQRTKRHHTAVAVARAAYELLEERGQLDDKARVELLRMILRSLEETPMPSEYSWVEQKARTITDKTQQLAIRTGMLRVQAYGDQLA